MYFGTIGFHFLFNMIFTYRYCRMLEEGSFRGRTADFLFMFIFGGAVMTVSFQRTLLSNLLSVLCFLAGWNILNLLSAEFFSLMLFFCPGFQGILTCLYHVYQKNYHFKFVHFFLWVLSFPEYCSEWVTLPILSKKCSYTVHFPRTCATCSDVCDIS